MQKTFQLNDIFSQAREIELGGEKLLVEYDYRAYAMLETATAKSVYELKDDILDGKISLTNRLMIMFFGLLRHQKDFKIEKLENTKNIGFFLDKTAKPVLEAFFTPLLPPSEE